jgi:multiple sugar transport system ATP-binding protein
VIFGIRPEHIVVTDSGAPVQVTVVEPTGATTQVNVRTGTDDITCEFRERLPTQPGQTLRIAPLPDSAHLFDATSGQRLDTLCRQ